MKTAERMLEKACQRLNLECKPQVEQLDPGPFVTRQYRHQPLNAVWHSDGTQEGRIISGATWIVELTYLIRGLRSQQLVGIDAQVAARPDFDSLQALLDSLQ